ncbi:MAG: cytochrome c-type biogenesis protein [Pararhizobium sp.]
MKRLVPFLAALVIFVTSACAPAFAVNPDEMLKDPVLEHRAREISAKLRCLVCQNESIDVSDADRAKDLRLLVRRRLVAGDTDQQVIDYLVSRYGEFVLLKPRFETKTLILWGAPVIVLLCGAAAMVLYARRRRTSAPGAPLSPEEQAALNALLSRDGRS